MHDVHSCQCRTTERSRPDAKTRHPWRGWRAATKQDTVKGNTRIRRLWAQHDRGRRPPSVDYFMEEKRSPLRAILRGANIILGANLAVSTIAGLAFPRAPADQAEVRLTMSPNVSVIRQASDAMMCPSSGPIALEKKRAAIKRATSDTSTAEAINGSSRCSSSSGSSEPPRWRVGLACLAPGSSMTRPVPGTDPRKDTADIPTERTTVPCQNP